MYDQTPFSMAPTLGGDDDEIGLLKQALALQHAPLAQNQWEGLGAALSGLGAGLGGQANPVMSAMLARRQNQIAALGQAATITGHQAAQQSQQAHLGLAGLKEIREAQHQQEQERLAQAQLAETKRGHDITGLTATTKALEGEDSPEGTMARMNTVEALAAKLGQPSPYQGVDKATLVKNTLLRRSLERIPEVHALSALMGKTELIPGVPVNPNFLEMAKTPEGQVQLYQLAKVATPAEAQVKMKQWAVDVIDLANKKIAGLLTQEVSRRALGPLLLLSKGDPRKTTMYAMALEQDPGASPEVRALAKHGREWIQAEVDAVSRGADLTGKQVLLADLNHQIKTVQLKLLKDPLSDPSELNSIQRVIAEASYAITLMASTATPEQKVELGKLRATLADHTAKVTAIIDEMMKRRAAAEVSWPNPSGPGTGGSLETDYPMFPPLPTRR